jgi:Homoserine dehydrogenase, NAD binding domain
MRGEIRVGLLGYGTVGSNVDQLLQRRARDLERRLGRRLRVVRALVRDPGKERPFAPAPGVLTTSFADLRDDASLDVVAEVMGGLEPTERYVRDLLAAGKPVVTSFASSSCSASVARMTCVSSPGTTVVARRRKSGERTSRQSRSKRSGLVVLAQVRPPLR